VVGVSHSAHPGDSALPSAALRVHISRVQALQTDAQSWHCALVSGTAPRRLASRGGPRVAQWTRDVAPSAVASSDRIPTLCARQRGSAGRGPVHDGAEFAGRFSSRYGPLFHKCVVDVAAKLAHKGASEAEAFRGAFRICRKSVGERRFDAHAARRDGTAVEDPGRAAAEYEALLVRYQVRADGRETSLWFARDSSLASL
jgi:hypothetical protein